jgi:uncharacterized protein YigE (DUF2233 family)
MVECWGPAAMVEHYLIVSCGLSLGLDVVNALQEKDTKRGMPLPGHFIVRLGFGLLILLMRAPGTLAESAPCRAITHEGSDYTVCEIDLRQQVAKFFWNRADGHPYGYLSSLPHTPGNRSGRLLFAINGGMYNPDYRPVGLYVENGRELVRVNTRTGPGNFHMKPNGVFYVAGQFAGVVETDSFLKQRPPADFATQSGPMLVISGRLHPRFARNGGSRKHRSGVGSRDANRLVFAVSETEVSFGEFARLFRDKLQCKNALFLDGGAVPSLYSPELGRKGNLLPLGPMIAIYDRAN